MKFATRFVLSIVLWYPSSGNFVRIVLSFLRSPNTNKHFVLKSLLVKIKAREYKCKKHLLIQC